VGVDVGVAPVSDDDWLERVLRRTSDDDADDEREADDAGGERKAGDADDDGSTARAETSREDETSDGTTDDPFDQDFASALDSAPSPRGLDGSGDEAGGPGDDRRQGAGTGAGVGPSRPDPGDGAGGTGQGAAPGGLGGVDDLGGGFDDLGGGFDDFGFGDDAGGFGEEAEFDSEIDRVEIGIEGLDEMILGGIPERSLMVAIGGAGTGKTTFGLQFLHRGLAAGDRGVYITLEESRDSIVRTADEKGWSFSEYVADDDLAVIDLDPVEMANSLASIRSDLPRLVDEFGAERLVLDSVSLLEMMYDHPAKRRSEVFDFARSLKEAGVTIMVTSEASAENPYTSRHGLIEYLADAVFVLQYVRPSDFRETRLAVEIQKIRDANHSRETKPYEITGDGISVYRQANIF
jgi:KaiC domain protein